MLVFREILRFQRTLVKGIALESIISYSQNAELNSFQVKASFAFSQGICYTFTILSQTLLHPH